MQGRRQRTRGESLLAVLACLGSTLSASLASGEPMRLADATPRWVVVQFEDSPSSHPDRLDRVYTKPFAAWLETDARGRIVVRVDGEVLEKNLFHDNDPVPGSFSDYVWVFDPDSGDVSASFSGTFAYAIDWGFTSTEIRARVQASMDTRRAGGFRGPEPVWGRALHVWCVEPGREGCREVPGARYDAARGYVNAVGYLAIDSPVTQFVTYSAVGEARFSELSRDLAVTPPVATAPPGTATGALVSRAPADPAPEVVAAEDPAR